MATDELKSGLTPSTMIRLAKMDVLDFLSRDQRRLAQSLGTGRTIAHVIERSQLPPPVAMGLLQDLIAQGIISVVTTQNATSRLTPAVTPQEAQPVTSPRKGSFSKIFDLDEATRQTLNDVEFHLANSNFFALFGLAWGSDSTSVKKAFYELSRRIHPDCFLGRLDAITLRKIEEMFGRVNQAQATLTDSNLREKYLIKFKGKWGGSGPNHGEASENLSETMSGDSQRDRRERLMRNPLMMHQMHRANLIREGRQAFESGNDFLAMVRLQMAESVGPLDPASAHMLAEAKKRLKPKS